MIASLLLALPLFAGADVRVGDSIVLYEDAKFYSAFPSIVARPGGDLLVAFRRAPNRRLFGESNSHTDSNSYLVSVRSKDGGKSWSRDPHFMYAHPFGGSQDPCMVQLKDGTLLCTSYAWASLTPDAITKLKQPVSRAGNYVFLGGYLLRSKDGGQSWQEMPKLPSAPNEKVLNTHGEPVPVCNRGAMCEGRDGRLYWVISASVPANPKRTATHLLISADKGENWTYSCVVAEDPKIEFNETSLYETPKGDLVAFLRSEHNNDEACIARSTDHGKSFTWQKAGFRGHPHYLMRLPDDRVLVVYGYRHAPFGIRARILNADCTDAATAAEIVLRTDGGNGDLGYPWATMIGNDRVLVVYYFNKADGIRHIAGTYLQIGSSK